MAVFNMIEEAEATGKVKEVFDDIKKLSLIHISEPTRQP